MSLTLNTPLSASLVADPQNRRLAICIHPDSVDVAVTSNVEDNALIWQHLDYDKATTSPLRALESVIYDNPLLLCDFARVDILIDTPRMLLVPEAEAVADTDLPRQRLLLLYPDADFQCVETTIGGAVMAMALDTDLANFLQRTFPQASIQHRIAPLATYYGLRRAYGNNGIFNAHLHGQAMDIIAFADRDLLMANTFAIQSTEDALFYVLTAARWLGYDDATDRMLVSGDAATRDALLPLLQQYISHAMPAIFPTALFRIGADAMQVPFELLCLTLI